MITDSFDRNDRPIITLHDVYGEKKRLADVCVVTFSKVISDALLNTKKCEKIAEIGACNGSIPIYAFDENGRKTAFYLSPIGSAIASECLIETNWLCGAEKFVTFGSSGSLDFEKTAGKFVIPTDAYRDEGMSYHYAPPSDYIKIKNHAFVKDVFDSLRVPYVLGRTWTTDAFLRETVGQMEKRKSEGCIAVEMEAAGLQSVCDFYGFELYTFLVTGDVLSGDGYDASGLSDANHNVDKLSLALEIAKRV